MGQIKDIFVTKRGKSDCKTCEHKYNCTMKTYLNRKKKIVSNCLDYFLTDRKY